MEEFEAGKGGGVTFNQVTHQVEIVRLLAQSPVCGVRGHIGALDPQRPADGNCMAFLEFENGAVASLTYSAYDFFDSDEYHHWVAEGGTDKRPGNHGAMRRAAAMREHEAKEHAERGFGGRTLDDEQPYLPHFGVVIATCERGDLRLSRNGLLWHGVEGTTELPVQCGRGRSGQGDALDALWDAVRRERASPHDGRWGRATLETVLAIRRSARERREILLVEQP
jgi:phthalate 4,5-cis-dihydrodiol dehydrogenase